MYCPRCATQTTDETNFCNKCGLQLRSTAEAQPPRASSDQFDWSKTWLVEMLLTDDERMRRRAAADISEGPEGTTLAEMKRAKEVKGGIITAFVGIGVAIFLWFFLGAIAGSVEARDPTGAVVLRHVWAAGIIPFFVGIGIVMSALFVDTGALRLAQTALRLLQLRLAEGARGKGRTTSELPMLDAAPSVVSSVTEHTTNLLSEPVPGRRGVSTGPLGRK